MGRALAGGERAGGEVGLDGGGLGREAAREVDAGRVEKRAAIPWSPSTIDRISAYPNLFQECSRMHAGR